MSPCNWPLGPRRTALQAPAMAAVGSTSSSRPMVLTLCGMVIRAPRRLASLKTDFKNAGKSGGLQPMGMTTALTPALANQGL